MPTWNAIAPPGLEPVIARELEQLGIRGQITPGAVRFEGDPARVLPRVPWMRGPARVLLEVGRGPARTLDELAVLIRGMPWADHLRPRDELEVAATARRSRLRRIDAVEKKALNAIHDALRGKPLPPVREGRPRRAQRVQVRLEDDQAQVAIDCGGELLHIRGWRAAQGKAPLRENLAACMLLAAGWAPDEPLLDPFCGSGTIPIEAALWAAGRPPAPGRPYAYEAWPSQVGKLRPAPAPAPQPAQIFGSDHHAPAVDDAANNARRAKVEPRWSVADVAELGAPCPHGLILTNPPYGARLGQQVDGVYAALGRALRGPFSGWRAAFLCPDPQLAALVSPAAGCLTTFSNGGITVGLYAVEPAESAPTPEGPAARGRGRPGPR